MRVLDDFSLEMTAKDVPGLERARPHIPRGTRINITFLANEDLPMRLSASKAVQDFGFVPVPHIAARRLASPRALTEMLGALHQADAVEHVCIVGGDPRLPEGPYSSAGDVIATGLLPGYGVTEVSVAGYPGGHPDISESDLWEALEAKVLSLDTQRLSGTIVTQFGFDVDAVFAWVEQVRARGIDMPIRVGVPGPAGIKRLLGFSARFGVASSASVARKYGMSLTNLFAIAGPDRFIADLEAGYEPSLHGVVKLHFYTFGGLSATSEWIRRYRQEAASGC